MSTSAADPFAIHGHRRERRGGAQGGRIDGELAFQGRNIHQVQDAIEGGAARRACTTFALGL
jgi:hypothetical protein